VVNSTALIKFEQIGSSTFGKMGNAMAGSGGCNTIARRALDLPTNHPRRRNPTGGFVSVGLWLLRQSPTVLLLF
jgi:hypothetical protein